MTFRGNDFGLDGQEDVKLGWMKHYGKYRAAEDRVVPDLVKGDVGDRGKCRF